MNIYRYTELKYTNYCRTPALQIFLRTHELVSSHWLSSPLLSSPDHFGKKVMHLVLVMQYDNSQVHQPVKTFPFSEL